jgi:hypothetical protein
MHKPILCDHEGMGAQVKWYVRVVGKVVRAPFTILVLPILASALAVQLPDLPLLGGLEIAFVSAFSPLDHYLVWSLPMALRAPLSTGNVAPVR